MHVWRSSPGAILTRTLATSIAEFRVAEVRSRYFGQNRPASTLVQVSALANPDYKIEIEAIAVAP